MTTRPFTRATLSACAAAACALLAQTSAHAVSFQTETLSGSFDSTVSAGTGVRLKDPSTTLINAGNMGGPPGELSPLSGMGDQGNLNYGKGDPFTSYLKGSHELLVKAPEDITFLGRFTWIRDFSATHTTGYISSTPPIDSPDGLSDPARDALRSQVRLLDFWVSKRFSIGEESARIRIGNQVINWGESLFLPGGINSTNAMDIMKLSQPGTQLKEAVLAAPMVSIATGLGYGFNAEAYVQTDWNKSYFPPTGSYWSVVNGLGKGSGAYGITDTQPNQKGQWGASLRYQPDSVPLNLGLYAMNYTDKTPNLALTANGPQWQYLEDRKMYGISANMPVGDWAIGTELSYRPKDAIFLSPNTSGCSSQNGNCWVDTQRYQWALTGLLSLTPSNAGSFLKLIGAQTATLLAEAVVIGYPKLKQDYGGDLVAAGGWGWGNELAANMGTNQQVPVGSKYSSGFNFDFSWVYDGTLIPGWQVVPEVYYFQALKGRTPNIAGTLMQGAKSANFTVSFIQNPAKWQFAVNYAKFWGGDSVYDQPYRDRDYIGVTLSRNF
ncbi:DUF1302 domain-containing protein [Variovorax brevis]